MWRLKPKCWVVPSWCAPFLGFCSFASVFPCLAAPGLRFQGLPCLFGMCGGCPPAGAGWSCVLVAFERAQTGVKTGLAGAWLGCCAVGWGGGQAENRV